MIDMKIPIRSVLVEKARRKLSNVILELMQEDGLSSNEAMMILAEEQTSHLRTLVRYEWKEGREDDRE